MRRDKMQRDKKVMMDRDLAELYGVGTAQLKRALKRNIGVFLMTLCLN